MNTSGHQNVSCLTHKLFTQVNIKLRLPESDTLNFGRSVLTFRSKKLSLFDTPNIRAAGYSDSIVQIYQHNSVTYVTHKAGGSSELSVQFYWTTGCHKYKE